MGGARRPRRRGACRRPRSTWRPCWPARTRWIRRPWRARSSRPRRPAAPAARAAVPARAASTDRLDAGPDFVTTPARELWRRSRPRPTRSASTARPSSTGLDPTLAAVARTLFARHRSDARRRGRRCARPSSRACWRSSAAGSTSGSSTPRASWPRPRPRPTPTQRGPPAAGRARASATAPRARPQRKETTTVLNQPTNQTRPRPPQQEALTKWIQPTSSW